MQAFRLLDFFKRVMIGVFQCTSIGPIRIDLKAVLEALFTPISPELRFQCAI